ncbi:hypothetical protein SAY86_017998 [Trapa natans]|uniref:Uncharacterized protein n=1 Tax=Trapa natans TaxID=22666 RepID=A0AAN7LTH9_TRANT|nr:hypothetical protein SAY86_017998 [Trapa natans]
MTRRCSHCSNNGHNSRTCPTRGGAGAGGPSAAGVKIFGDRLVDGSTIKKSASMGNLSAHFHSSLSASPNTCSPDPGRDAVHFPGEYLSDGTAHGSSHRRGEKKKGVPWTEKEHRLFLIGLQKLGKGDWRGISRNYVKSRTPTQVASHAQKYYIRQTHTGGRKRRSSLFDMTPDVEIDPPLLPEKPTSPPSAKGGSSSKSNLPSLDLSLGSEAKAMEISSENPPKEHEDNLTPTSGFHLFFPGFFHTPIPVPLPFPICPPSIAQLEDGKCPEATSFHQVLKPIPSLLKEPVNVNELVGMSQLSLVGKKSSSGMKEILSQSFRFLGKSSRQSAFHLNSGPKGPIQAV